jgi:NAD(P) transhydrogenase subunit alpha
MQLGILKETHPGETRVALTPDTVKKLIQAGLKIVVETQAGTDAGFLDIDYTAAGAQIAAPQEILQSDLLALVRKPSSDLISKMKRGSVLVSMLEPYKADGTLEALARANISAFAMEAIPRTSRAQSMDALSSQANIAGYRAVLEAAAHYPRFFPVMMTSAGSAKAVQLAVLGAGVAGLQAIATARRLGAKVEAFDVRPETREQIESLGAKFMDLKLEETGVGQGGYAKALSEDGQKRQQAALAERLKKMDVVISTANIPGRKAPVLITEEAVRGMRAGSVIVDLAAENGGNCPLTEAGKVVRKMGVTLVGHTNYPAFVPGDSSSFYGKNIYNLLQLMLKPAADGKPVELALNLSDDIIEAALVTHQGEVRFGRPKNQPTAVSPTTAPAAP